MELKFFLTKRKGKEKRKRGEKKLHEKTKILKCIWKEAGAGNLEYYRTSFLTMNVSEFS